MVKMLLENPATSLPATSALGETPIDLAKRQSKGKIIELLKRAVNEQL